MRNSVVTLDDDVNVHLLRNELILAGHGKSNHNMYKKFQIGEKRPRCRWGTGVMATDHQRQRCPLKTYSRLYLEIDWSGCIG
ncbi:hypothetical protein PoB_004231700 [Plakobranchus ocellatus]|uniref:Uncharacterized protein n=1 Tax=Plakobranchus ocellatus TaxID=259542 RepID=A0AAV4B9L6_9GAST|nr:hypothetical protein PoB_004231700 [Plakobranchus ocellatus]